MEIGDSIRLSQVALPEGVSIVALGRGDDHDQAVASVQKTRGSKEDDEAETEGEEAEGGEEAAAE